MKNIRQQVKRFRMAAIALAMFTLLLAGAVLTAQAQTFTSLHSFQGVHGNDGAIPNGLVQGTNGYLYGTTGSGGASDAGTVFKISTNGVETPLWSFNVNTGSGDVDGEGNNAALALATNGSFYGTTEENSGGCGVGEGSCGVVFKITTGGALTEIHNFCDDSVSGVCVDGINPEATMIQASNGDLYGTTRNGGAYNQGSLFKITPAGVLTTIHSFCATVENDYCADGEPPFSGLVQGTDGNLYGTASFGGTNNTGTIFKITQGGTFTTLHSIGTNGDLGQYPTGGLVQGANGNFYGTTFGGAGCGCNGTFFTMTPGGTVTTLYSFCTQSDCPDGTGPGGIVLATDGNFYGLTTGSGGVTNSGTIFKITQGGTLSTVHTFAGTDGLGGGMILQDTTGTFYGITANGGAGWPDLCNGCEGTAFSLSMGLGAFVETVPTSGKVGASVRILGNNLTGATSVTFNGTAATFTVVSSSEITTTVPTGATTGTVKVKTASHRTLSSNVSFMVP
jgi:uncharacterized repeat protein (TIGR03803 family)